MCIASKFDPKSIEGKWYSYWIENDIFSSKPDNREAYTVVIPPPNVTGVLHMGHMLNNTIQDILVRRARMLGKNACWVPGTDHASIATEAKVVNLLAEQGIKKTDIGREKFLEHAWEWKEKHDGIIYDQLKKLGASCDWSRAKFTLDEDLYESVIEVFNKLHEEGLIYRGARMINWDPKAKTALSDEEVIRKEVKSKLYYVKYKIVDSDEFITIATTRPETILGDSGICVHPEDDRYTHLKGKQAIIPMVDRKVPIIFDDYIDKEFGTGALKVTPAHDINDYELGLKYNLEVIDTLNEDGTMSEAAQFYVGQDRFKVRKQIVKDLDEMGQLVKEEDLRNNVGFSERNPDTVIEPRISTQWFLKMDELVKPALKAVKEDDVKIHPSKFKNVYNHWLTEIKDWCISRQLWWGHRIPAWFNSKGEYVVARNIQEAIEKFKAKGDSVTENELKQDEDVLDTWFSSWLWPFSVFGWNEDTANEDLMYYYPTNDLVTGHDIIFFWVARMIIAGYHFTGQKPFSNVYFTGMVRDKQGRKMSKSLGNSPDALDLMERFGADGVRVGMMLSAPAGNDLHFDESLCLQGRNFANKIWNAYRLVKTWETDQNLQPDELAERALDWYQSRLNQSVEQLNQMYDQFRISEALMTVYKLVWDDFCSWFLEMVKPDYRAPISSALLDRIISLFEDTLKLLHPFMPFISEEIYHGLNPRGNGDSLGTTSWPEIGDVDDTLLENMRLSQKLISNVRQLRNEIGLSPKEVLNIMFKTEPHWVIERKVIQKLANVSELQMVTEKPENSKVLMVDKSEFYIPVESEMDSEEEKERITKELEYTRGFLLSVEKKLSNEKFVSNAPANVVESEKKKKADAEAKLKVLEQQLETL